MAAPPKTLCNSCRYYVVVGEHHGSCHRFPNDTTHKRVSVNEYDWCGEHKKPTRKKGKKDGAEANV